MGLKARSFRLAAISHAFAVLALTACGGNNNGEDATDVLSVEESANETAREQAEAFRWRANDGVSPTIAVSGFLAFS